MKKIGLLFIGLFIFVFFQRPEMVSASTVTVHYNGASRLDTYTYANNYVGTLHNVVGYNNVGNNNVENQLKNSVIFVAHNHGMPGIQLLSDEEGNESGISGTNGGGAWKAISSMSTVSSRPLYIAIYYGCNTGVTTSSYGNIMAQTTSKMAKSAVAWKMSTYVVDVNLWNKYFFFKARSLTSGSAALTYADTQLAADTGSINASGMKTNRVTSGSFNWQFGNMKKDSSLNTMDSNLDINNVLIKNKKINFLDKNNIEVEINSANKNSFGDELLTYQDDNKNDYIFKNDVLVGYVNNNNSKDDNIITVVNMNTINSNLNNYSQIASKYLTSLLNENITNIKDYTLIDAKYLESTDEYSYVFGKKLNGYLVNDGIIISINSDKELVSFSAAQQGLFDKYNEIQIDDIKVSNFIEKEMSIEKEQNIEYTIDKQFLNIVDNKLVLQIGMTLNHNNKYYSTKTLYYNVNSNSDEIQ